MPKKATAALAHSDADLGKPADHTRKQLDIVKQMIKDIADQTMGGMQNTAPMRISVAFAVVAVLCILAMPSGTVAQSGSGITGNQYRTWMNYGGGPDASKYVASDQIDKSNVGQLEVAWTYPTRDGKYYLFSPVIVDNVIYLMARNNSLVALDASTGKEIWVHEGLRGFGNRGLNYWESEDREDRRLIFQINDYIQEIDARSGRSILAFGNNGLVDLKEGFDRDPEAIGRVQSRTPGVVFENLIIVGSTTGEGYLATPGEIRAYDVVTGKRVWTFRTIPRPGEFGHDTWPEDAWRYAGGANTWGEMSLDVERGILYAPTGSASYDFYGADRIGANLFANCLLALDVRSGKRLWHFQMVHHDLWDYDATAAPQLVTVRHDGKTNDAVAQATKQGFLYVFDRVTGEPLWPIEERPVPESDVMGEQAWPTQPFPTAPPPFARQDNITPDDVGPYLLTPEERASLKDRIASARIGLYVPPSTEQETVMLPGAIGGANLGATAANPPKGLVYVLTHDWPGIVKLGLVACGHGASRDCKPKEPQQERQSVYEQRCQVCHGRDAEGSSTAPALFGVERLGFAEFRQVVIAGKGKMPAHTDLGADDIEALFEHLGGNRQPEHDAALESLGGPVVASGGAPGGLEVRSSRLTEEVPYPDDVDVPENRYYARTGTDFPYMLRPPWSEIVAYDLNNGTIKWKVPLGEDFSAAKEGAVDTGGPAGALHHGIIVTSTGLLFANARDGKIRAYDADSGEVLWSATLPAGTEGIPAMYEVEGRQYLVVAASAALTSGRESAWGSSPKKNEQGAYVAFALPKPSAVKE